MVSRVAVLVALLAAVPAFAQVAAPKTAPPPNLTFAQIGLFVYPAKGQTPDQQKKDEDACYEWAEANTGLTMVAGQVDARLLARRPRRTRGKARRSAERPPGPRRDWQSGRSPATRARARRLAPWRARLAAYAAVPRPSRRLARKAPSKPSRQINRPWTSSRKRRGPVSRRGVIRSDEQPSCEVYAQQDTGGDMSVTLSTVTADLGGERLLRSATLPGHNHRRMRDRSRDPGVSADRRLPDEGTARRDDAKPGARRIEEGQRAFSNRTHDVSRLSGRAAHHRRRPVSVRRGPRLHRLTCAGRDHLRRRHRRHLQRADCGERRERRPAREPRVRVRRGRRQGDPALRTHGLWRDQGGDRRRRDGQLDGVAGACEAGDVGHNASMARSRARTPRTSTPSHGPTSCSASTTSAAAAQFWRTWKRRHPSRWSAGCTTWSPVSWSSCPMDDSQRRTCGAT